MDIIHLFLSWEISTIYKWFFGDLNPQIELQTSLFADVAAAQWDIRQEVNIEVYCWYIHLSTYFFRLSWIKYCHFFIYRRYHWSGRVRCNEMGCSKDRFLGSSTDDPAILQVPSKLCFFSHGNEEKTAVDRLLYSWLPIMREGKDPKCTLMCIVSMSPTDLVAEIET